MKYRLLFISIAIASVFFLSGTRSENFSLVAAEHGRQASPELLHDHVHFMTVHPEARNYKNLDRLNRVADYISDEFISYGLSVEEQTFLVDGKSYRNIIATVGPKTGERLIVGAHYDVSGNQPGADDNASGVAGLLELARLASIQSHKINKRVDFVAYTLEEPPFFATKQMGSYVHAESLKKNNIDIIGMICLEMIGYFDESPGSQRYPNEQMRALYPDNGNFIALIANLYSAPFLNKIKTSMIPNTSIDVQTMAAPDSVSGITLSDHRNYWALRYPAIMVTDTSFFRNPNYHEVTDTIDTLSFPKMALVIDGLIGSLKEL